MTSATIDASGPTSLDRARRLLAERRRDLEHLIEVARASDGRESEVGRLTAALEEVNLLEICLFSPTDALTLFG